MAECCFTGYEHGCPARIFVADIKKNIGNALDMSMCLQACEEEFLKMRNLEDSNRCRERCLKKEGVMFDLETEGHDNYAPHH
jgi:ribosomal protein L16/L10AE